MGIVLLAKENQGLESFLSVILTVMTILTETKNL
jgi:hypothetical protein